GTLSRAVLEELTINGLAGHQSTCRNRKSQRLHSTRLALISWSTCIRNCSLLFVDHQPAAVGKSKRCDHFVALQTSPDLFRSASESPIPAQIARKQTKQWSSVESPLSERRTRPKRLRKWRSKRKEAKTPGTSTFLNRSV